jgi:tetratricopeptide (TPR) repeat protein
LFNVGSAIVFERLAIARFGSASLLVIVTALPAQADAGVPMLAVMGVPMWALLLLIIPLEALIAHRILSLNWSKCWQISGVSNLVSTIAGVPLTWVALAAGEIGLEYLRHDLHQTVQLPAPYQKVAFLVLTAPWLYPFESDMYWMLPTAALLLLVPFFFVSVWIEYTVARRFVGAEPKLMSWAWKANALSYSLMAIIACGWLVTSINGHNVMASDDRHRSVDLVSADRLWEIAMEKASYKGGSTTVFHGGSTEGLAKREMERYYWKARHQMESGQPKEAEKTYLSALAMIDSDQYQSTTTLEDRYGDGLNIINSLADLYYKQSRFAEAVPLYQRLVRLEDETLSAAKPEDFKIASYPLNLPICYQKLGEPEKADKFYQHAITQNEKLQNTLKSDLIPTLIAYGNFLKNEGNFEAAEKIYTRSATTRDDNVHPGIEAPKALAEFYMERKQFDRARAVLTQAIEEQAANNMAGEFVYEGHYSPLALYLGRCDMEMGNLAESEHYLKLALRGESSYPEIAETYARLMGKRGDMKQATIWQQRAADAKAAESGRTNK